MPLQTELLPANKSEDKNKDILSIPNNYVVVDIETTGLNPVKNEIIELSAIKVVDNKIFEKFSYLIKPNEVVGWFITNLTGITNDMLKNAPTIEEVLPEFHNFVAKEIIVGHNIRFDISFIKAHSKRVFDTDFVNKSVDTLKIARKVLPQLQSYKLQSIAEHYKIKTAGLHRGLVDCEITYQVLTNLRQSIIERCDTAKP